MDVYFSSIFLPFLLSRLMHLCLFMDLVILPHAVIILSHRHSLISFT